MRLRWLWVLIGLWLFGCASSVNNSAPLLTPTIATPNLPVTSKVTATPSVAPTMPPTATPTPLPGGIFIDTSQNLGKVSPLVYGTNHGPWAFLTVQLWDAYKNSGLRFMRFPGGNWGDENDLTAQHLDDFMQLVNMGKVVPQISVRLRGSTPEYAVSVLDYMLKQKYNVPYWSIGNEPSLYASQDETWDTVKYNQEWRKFALALKARDPSIKLIGPDIHQFNGTPQVDPKDKAGRDWLDEFLKANGDLVDIVSIHRYPFPVTKGVPAPPRAELYASAREWDKTIPNLRARIRAATGRDLPVAVTEFNSDWVGKINGETTPDSVSGALWIADSLGRMLRQRVDIVAQFTLQMNSGNGSLGIFDHYDPRPVYYVYALYKQFGDDLVFASSDDETVSAYAAKRADGKLTFIVLNLSDSAKTMPLHFQDPALRGKADVFLFDAAHKAEKTGTVELSNNATLTLPPNSMSLYVMSPQ